MRPGGNPKLAEHHQRVVFRNTRRVWAAVTRTPHATVLDLAEATDLAHDTVQRALHRLRDAGYIDFDPRSTHARRVIVPFVIIRRKRQ